jgi:hypothetical protein
MTDSDSNVTNFRRKPSKLSMTPAAIASREYRGRQKAKKLGTAIDPSAPTVKSDAIDEATTLPAVKTARHDGMSVIAMAAADGAMTLASVKPMPNDPTLTFTFVMLVAALGIATVSAFFAVTGLTHVFVGAFWPVVAMGVALEFSKLAAIGFLGRHGAGPLRIVIIALVAILMLLSAIGRFGFLSAANISHVASHRAAVDLRVAHVKVQTKVQAGVVADITARIAQIDTAIAETIRRGRAVAAMALADQQKRARADLVAEREQASRKLAGLENEAAQIRADRAGLAADNGPISYLAELLGADADDVVRWFIALVAVLLDPLAGCLLLAATRRRAQ